MMLSQKCHRLGGLKNKLLFTVLEAEKSKTKALADSVSGGGPVLDPHVSEGPRSSLGSLHISTPVLFMRAPPS